MFWYPVNILKMISQRAKRSEAVDSSDILAATYLSLFRIRYFSKYVGVCPYRGQATSSRSVRLHLCRSVLQRAMLHKAEIIFKSKTDWNRFSVRFLSQNKHIMKASLTFHRLKCDWAHKDHKPAVIPTLSARCSYTCIHVIMHSLQYRQQTDLLFRKKVWFTDKEIKVKNCVLFNKCYRK